MVPVEYLISTHLNQSESQQNLSVIDLGKNQLTVTYHIVDVT